MKYTVVVKHFTSTNGNYSRRRYDNVPKRIIKFLLKYHFSFQVGIAKNTANMKTAEHYIEIYAKNTLFLKKSNEENTSLNLKLYKKLRHLGKAGLMR